MRVNTDFPIDYSRSDSMIRVKVNRGWAEHLLKVLQGKKNGEYKQKLIAQIEGWIEKGKNQVKCREENGMVKTN